MEFNLALNQAVANREFDKIIELVPYAQFLGMKAVNLGDEQVFVLPNNEQHMGNPLLPAIHGGAIAGFLEMSSILQLLLTTNSQSIPKIINFSIDYLRPGYARDTFAYCSLTKQGRNVANVSCIAWQGNRKQPIATSRAHFLME
ncbi:PaaI family thioesterase [Paraferrimonas sp. SM1919]|uniref:PaaI family thioesterase n=1 Tax=Paraferrimonas sp. SM1919 TaxID=2662263 RepID=UPI0013D34B6C|nr:PaaI family thioesterase [Paraferrimonas sp. SM1919]